MADTKISALSAASTLDGTEIVPVVQGGTTKRSTVALINAQSGTSVRGNLGYAEITADQTGIGTSITDLTGLAVTVTVNSGERIKVTGYVPSFWNPSATMQLEFLIRESSTTLNNSRVPVTSGGNNNGYGMVQWIGTPSAGSHTYKLSLKTSTGTVNVAGGATNPAFILVEGIGT